MGEGYDYLFKLVLVGSAGVGKTSLLHRFADDEFNVNQMTTIGIDFKIKTVEIHGKRVKLQIWDTAGQERYRTITPAYYRGAHGVFLVYDVTDPHSLEQTRAFAVEADRLGAQPVKMLLGNKTDLERKVAPETAQQLANEVLALFTEASAKDGLNVQGAFITLATHILQKTMERHTEAGGEELLAPRQIGERRANRGHFEVLEPAAQPAQAEQEESGPPQNASVHLRLLEGKSAAMSMEYSNESTHVAGPLELGDIFKEGSMIITIEFSLTGAQGQQAFIQRMVQQVSLFKGPGGRRPLPFRIRCTFPQFDTCHLHIVPTDTPPDFEQKLNIVRALIGPSVRVRVDFGWNLNWIARNWQTLTLADILQIEIQASGVTLSKKTLEQLRGMDPQATPAFRDKQVPQTVREVETNVKQWAGMLEQGVAPGTEGPPLNLRLSNFISALLAEAPPEVPKLDTHIKDAPPFSQAIPDLARDGLPHGLRLWFLVWARDVRNVQAIHMRNREGKGPSLRFHGLEVEHMLEVLDAIFPENENEQDEAGEAVYTHY